MDFLSIVGNLHQYEVVLFDTKYNTIQTQIFSTVYNLN